MRIQSRNGYDDGLDDLDPYFTCREAIESLIILEGDRLPRRLWEPAAGDGAIVRPLRETGRFVVASDIHDYGLDGCAINDYLTAASPLGVQGIITNPPYKKALQFAEKALREVPYVALLVRSNFDIEGVKRMAFRAQDPSTRIWRSARRLPMMHRYGWTGKRALSNTPYCWQVWERGAPREFPQDFDWQWLLSGEAVRLQPAAEQPHLINGAILFGGAMARGGRRPGAGRPRGPDVLRELNGIKTALHALYQQRRDEAEAMVPILRRLTGIERHLGLCETPQMPRPSRRRPLDT